MAGYSASEKALHRFYLNNYFLARASMEMDQMLHGQKAAKTPVTQYVFVSGLARAGTTALMRGLFETGNFASLQYSNMPIVLAPNLWNKKLKLETQERAHGDGIMVDGNSPEEFDEFFWKAFLKDSYIGDGLLPHEVPAEVLEKYKVYVNLVCHSKGKQRYISKNNNNILRLDALRQLENSHIIMLFRDPVTHANSLMKLHKSFSADQESDPFMLDYFNYLGHHEFGKGHKPFILLEDFQSRRSEFSTDSLDYWIYNWINYYEYLLGQDLTGIHLVAFEDLIRNPEAVYSSLQKILDFTPAVSVGDKHKPTSYPELSCDPVLRKRALGVYEKLRNLSLGH
ncbi:sulfotransferase [Robiginitalea sediminis]|uniref:sulfotransferase n=1 Tax=Robiginitalea sediminis TaxID=1982593 RepID=UPI000B4BEE03|nr:sulfotransferase [Robiginitalea sediminis]